MCVTSQNEGRKANQEKDRKRVSECSSSHHHLHGNTVNSRHHVALMRAGVFPHGSKPVVGGNETSL